MTYTDVKKIHKNLQKKIKTEKTLANKVFIRHWNVFYNAYRGRDISRIEQKSHTILYSLFIKEIADLLEVEISDITTEYTSDKKGYTWLSYQSSLFKGLKESLEDKEGSQAEEACHV